MTAPPTIPPDAPAGSPGQPGQPGPTPHTPVVVTDLATWHELAPRGGAATTVAVSSAES